MAISLLVSLTIDGVLRVIELKADLEKSFHESNLFMALI